MQIDATLAAQALKDALEKFPAFAPFGPRLAYRELFQGGTFLVQYESDPPRNMEGAWDFQNAVVKGYKRLAGI
jgi:hypothetical protein